MISIEFQYHNFNKHDPAEFQKRTKKTAYHFKAHGVEALHQRMISWLCICKEIYTPSSGVNSRTLKTTCTEGDMKNPSSSLEPQVQSYKPGKYFSEQAIALYIVCESHAHNSASPTHHHLHIPPA